jgi:hypothetical protein
MPKSLPVGRQALRVGATKNQLLIMQQVNLHQQKLIALIIAGVAFISLILNWSVPKGFAFVESQNGFHSWGFLSLLGILGVIAVTLAMGNKANPYEGQNKQIVMGAFGVSVLGALIFLLRLLTGSQSGGFGETIKFSDIAKPGIGLFLCLIASLAGIAWVYGLIKLPVTTPHSATPPPPPPPPPPKM